MTSHKDIVSGLDAVHMDLLEAANAYSKGERLYWDDDTWSCMAQNVKEALDYIERIHQRNINMSWELNPDRMGK